MLYLAKVNIQRTDDWNNITSMIFGSLCSQIVEFCEVRMCL